MDTDKSFTSLVRLLMRYIVQYGLVSVPVLCKKIQWTGFGYDREIALNAQIHTIYHTAHKE